MKAILFTSDGKELYTSWQVAAMLGIERKSMIVFIGRHEELKPELRILQDLFWRKEEIDALRKAKLSARPGRPKRND